MQGHETHHAHISSTLLECTLLLRCPLQSVLLDWCQSEESSQWDALVPVCVHACDLARFLRRILRFHPRRLLRRHPCECGGTACGSQLCPARAKGSRPTRCGVLCRRGRTQQSHNGGPRANQPTRRTHGEREQYVQRTGAIHPARSFPAPCIHAGTARRGEVPFGLCPSIVAVTREPHADGSELS